MTTDPRLPGPGTPIENAYVGMRKSLHGGCERNRVSASRPIPGKSDDPNYFVLTTLNGERPERIGSEGLSGFSMIASTKYVYCLLGCAVLSTMVTVGDGTGSNGHGVPT